MTNAHSISLGATSDCNSGVETGNAAHGPKQSGGGIRYIATRQQCSDITHMPPITSLCALSIYYTPPKKSGQYFAQSQVENVTMR
jgi:hypothetical protein